MNLELSKNTTTNIIPKLSCFHQTVVEISGIYIETLRNSITIIVLCLYRTNIARLKPRT